MKSAALRRYLSMLLARSGRRGQSAHRRAGRRLGANRILRAVVLLGMASLMLLIGLWWFAAIDAVMRTAGVTRLKEFSVQLTKAAPRAEIGRKDLGQAAGPSSAEEQGHIELALDAATGAVNIRNIAHERRLLLTFQKSETGAAKRFETFAERIQIPRNKISRLYFTGGSATFTHVDEKSFDLTISASKGAPQRSFHFDALRDAAAGPAVGFSADAECLEPTWLLKLRRSAVGWYNAGQSSWAKLNRREWEPDGEIDIATLGGKYNCVDDLRVQIGKMGELSWRQLKIVMRGRDFMIAPFNPFERNKWPIAFATIPEGSGNIDAAPRRGGFSDAVWRIDDPTESHGSLRSLIVGRTTYDVAVDCNRRDPAREPCRAGDKTTVRLIPVKAIQVFKPSECASKVGETCQEPGSQPAAECPAGALRCWKWSGPRNILADGAGSVALEQMNGKDRALRFAFAALALVISLSLKGAPTHLPAFFFRRQARPRRAPVSPLPFVLTVLSVLLALAPDVLALTHHQLDARTALWVMLLNWWFAGAVLLVSVSGMALGAMWIAVMTLAAIGSTALAVMSIDGDATSWSSYFIRQKYLFLDLVPPMIVAVATCPVRSLHPILRELVFSVDRKYWLVRFVPVAIVALSFVAWFVAGNQTGFSEGFQPAEAGKFAAVMLAASALLRFDPDTRRRSRAQVGASSRLASAAARICFFVILLFILSTRSDVSTIVAVALVAFGLAASFLLPLAVLALAAFFALLIGVPVVRSDWSPALIMTMLVGGLLAAFLVPLCLRVIGGVFRRVEARARVPLVFRPKVRRRWFGPGVFAVLFLLTLAVTLTLSPAIVMTAGAKLLSLGGWHDQVEENLYDLEHTSMGLGRRVVAERFIAWFDLDFHKPAWPNCQAPHPPGQGSEQIVRDGALAQNLERTCYRDVEWQVIRARKAVAAAPCRVAEPVNPGNWPALRTVTGLLSRIFPSPPCTVPGSDPEDAQNEADRPIRIPVVSSDFAGAYLISRLGVPAAVLFYAAQILLLSVGLLTIVRMNMTRSGNLLDAGLFRFVGVIVAGSSLLFLLQWVLSWSNVLGLLPVMGQPMTMLSYAVSHHLFMVLPCLTVLVVGIRFGAIQRPVLIPRGVPRTGIRLPT